MAAAELLTSDPRSGAVLRRWWLIGTVALSVAPLVAVVVLAPPADASPSNALVWLLFVGSSVHVGATAWFYTVSEVRGHMLRHRRRYLWVPVALVAGSSVGAATMSMSTMEWVLLAFFAWQFFHFQKQNLGLAALAARSAGAPPLAPAERRALVAAGIGGTAAIVSQPELLQLSVLKPAWAETAFVLVTTLGVTLFVGATVIGLVAVVRRDRLARPGSFVLVYAISSGFFLPVFLFDSPYAAVAGLTVAHGLQYLLLMALIAGTPTGVAPARVGILMFMNLAMVVGLGLNQAAHMHGSAAPFDRALFGVFLGVSMAHFVIDAGLWRLRDEFPRSFLGKRLPYLLSPM